MDFIKHHIFFLILLLATQAAQGGVLDELERLGGPVRLGQAREFLPPDEAFRLVERVDAEGRLELSWEIAEGYYLYRDKFGVAPLSSELALAPEPLPEGEFKDDPEFGRVAIFRDAVAMTVPIAARPADAGLLEAEVRYQGCAEDGICYPPIKKTVGFSLLGVAQAAESGAVPAGPALPAVTQPLAETDRIAAHLAASSLPAIVATFLGLGLLLAFTPCVLPMVPILSGIIVGQKQPVGTARAFTLSGTYVIAMAATYTVFGVLAGLAGQNLQILFQHPVAIVSFALIFVILSLSMFGFYELQLPAALQTRLDRISRAQQGGTLAGVAVMGVLSALIVGPCVAPPLAGALAYIGQTGSPVTGGAALFALGLGMGAPLLLVGTSAGALVPRAGAWMESVKRVFGVIFLGVAIWFLERVLPAALVLVLWAVLLIGSAVFLGALRRLDGDVPARARLAQALGLVLVIHGASLLVGAAAGGTDPLRPLAPFAAGPASAETTNFVAIKSANDLDDALEGADGRAVMVDFYADWCVECKHLEKETFTAPAVRSRFADMVLLRADVTANDAVDQALLRRFELFGPPAVLFFRDGREVREQRLVGFADAEEFSHRLDRVSIAR